MVMMKTEPFHLEELKEIYIPIVYHILDTAERRGTYTSGPIAGRTKGGRKADEI